MKPSLIREIPMKLIFKYPLACILLLSLAIVFPAQVLAETVSRLGDPTGYVNDYADVISSSDEGRLTSICEDLLRANTTEMAIVTINSLDGQTVEAFANDLFNKWGIGTGHADNGILILVAVNDHEARVETGYGVEHVIPDSLTVRIMENEAVPEFRKDDYGQGIINAATEFAKILNGEEYKSGTSFNIGMIFIPFALIGTIIMLIGLVARVKCPRCGSRVKLIDDREVLESDYSHSGIRKKDYECTVCHHQFSKMKIIPMLVSQAGSGGGSSWTSGWTSGGSSGWSGGGSSFGGFSGGSSGGGGGSVSW